MEVNRETFKGANNSTQNLILFDSILAVSEKLDGFNSECENKHTLIDTKLARSGKINKGITAATGLLGGFIAFFTSKIIGE